jgi:hypothetical protein
MSGCCEALECAMLSGAKNGSSYAASYSASRRSFTSGGGECARIFASPIQRAGVRARELSAVMPEEDMSRLIVSIGVIIGSRGSALLTKSDMPTAAG